MPYHWPGVLIISHSYSFPNAAISLNTCATVINFITFKKETSLLPVHWGYHISITRKEDISHLLNVRKRMYQQKRNLKKRTK